MESCAHSLSPPSAPEFQLYLVKDTKVKTMFPEECQGGINPPLRQYPNGTPSQGNIDCFIGFVTWIWGLSFWQVRLYCKELQMKSFHMKFIVFIFFPFILFFYLYIISFILH